LLRDADAADINSTSGTYTLQAPPAETIVVTAIHVVVVKRVPAPHATAIYVDPGDSCGSGGPGVAMPTWGIEVNLDSVNLKPKMTYYNGQDAITPVYGLQTK
jgi:hypothetical protein